MTDGSNNFDVRVRALSDEDRYAVTTRYDGKTASAEIEWDVDGDFIDLRVMRSVGDRGVTRRKFAGRPDLVAAKELGQRLFEKILPDVLGAQYLGAVRETLGAGNRLRLRLNLDQAPGLANVPWEFLHQTREGVEFLASSARSQVVRQVGVAHQLPQTAVEAPLRIGVIVAQPSNVSSLDLEAEWDRLNTALEQLVKVELVTIERLPGRWDALSERLSERDAMPHVVHYMGHGDFDPATGGGILLFEDDNGERKDVRGEQLATVLERDPPRLVFLNSCRGAKTSASDPFAGMAQGLLGRGVEAIVAMQFEITDRAAQEFSKGLYEAIAAGDELDVAVAEGRKRIRATDSLEWLTPALFLQREPRRFMPTPSHRLEAAEEAEATQAAEEAEAQANDLKQATHGQHAHGANPTPTGINSKPDETQEADPSKPARQANVDAAIVKSGAAPTRDQTVGGEGKALAQDDLDNRPTALIPEARKSFEPSRGSRRSWLPTVLALILLGAPVLGWNFESWVRRGFDLRESALWDGEPFAWAVLAAGLVSLGSALRRRWRIPQGRVHPVAGLAVALIAALHMVSAFSPDDLGWLRVVAVGCGLLLFCQAILREANEWERTQHDPLTLAPAMFSGLAFAVYGLSELVIFGEATARFWPPVVFACFGVASLGLAIASERLRGVAKPATFSVAAAMIIEGVYGLLFGFRLWVWAPQSYGLFLSRALAGVVALFAISDKPAKLLRALTKD